jgi:PadR family transcriptional regulator PadR
VFALDCEPRNFLRPCLLLLLREAPDHGYDLLDRLRTLGVADTDPGGVYRALRALERDGLVHSDWTPSAAGPARRTYHLSPAGDRALEGWATALAQVRDAMETYLRRYARLRAAAPPVRLAAGPAAVGRGARWRG